MVDLSQAQNIDSPRHNYSNNKSENHVSWRLTCAGFTKTLLDYENEKNVGSVSVEGPLSSMSALHTTCRASTFDVRGLSRLVDTILAFDDAIKVMLKVGIESADEEQDKSIVFGIGECYD